MRRPPPQTNSNKLHFIRILKEINKRISPHLEAINDESLPVAISYTDRKNTLSLNGPTSERGDDGRNILRLDITIRCDHLKISKEEEDYENWQERVEGLIIEIQYKHKFLLRQMTKSEKKKLVQELKQEGAFDYRYAAEFIAQKLEISRATVYNYLKG